MDDKRKDPLCENIPPEQLEIDKEQPVLKKIGQEEQDAILKALLEKSKK